MSHTSRSTNKMHANQRYVDSKRSARHTYYRLRPEVQSLALILVGIAAFIAILLLLLSR